jgi:ubiquinone/menaquinone biosynthesis C-methylase UbiE
LFGGYALTLREVRRLAARVPRHRPLVVLDVGGGAAGLAVRAVGQARRNARQLRVVVLERDAATLALARRACAAFPEILLVRADATALPIRSGAADVVTCTLTLHHLEPDEATVSLSEMARATRLGVIVNDLLRTRFACGLVWLGTRVLGCHPISRHDGPLSVRRAYSPAELAALAARAGLGPLAIRRHPVIGRLVAVAS